MDGVEPSTLACKASILPLNYTPIWYPEGDSNPQHADFEPAASFVGLSGHNNFGSEGGSLTHLEAV